MKVETCSCYVLLVHYILCNKVFLDYNLYISINLSFIPLILLPVVAEENRRW